MQKNWLVVLLVAGACPIFAQAFGPEVPVLGKTTFGINGLAVMEVALPSEASYNPAAMSLALDVFKEKQYTEADYGVLDLQGGPQVENDWQIYLVSLPKGAMRIARYGIRSNSREIAYLGSGPQVKFGGQTIEMSYGQKVRSNLYLGFALIPLEEIKTDISLEGTAIVNARAKSNQHGRVGVLYLPSKKISLGAVYTCDRIGAQTRLLSPLTGELMPIDMSADYHERLWTLGAAWQPAEGTSVFWAWQKGRITGSNVSEEIDLHSFGAQQFLNRHICVRLENNDNVWGYGLTCFNKGWTLGLSCSKSTYRRTEEYFGRTDVWYLWVGKGW